VQYDERIALRINSQKMLNMTMLNKKSDWFALAIMSLVGLFENWSV